MPIINADCIEHMNTMPPDSVDSIVTDPPYHLTSIVKRFGKEGSAPAQFGTDGAYARASRGFMGKEWDGGDIAFRTEVWEAALRVAKPGAYLLAFGGTRTFHRMAVAIEDAGWEIRDTVMWVYGSGFPKSHNVGKGIDKAAGAEREVLVGATSAPNGKLGGYKGERYKEKRQTPFGVVQDQPDITAPATEAARQWDGWGTALKPAWEPIIVARKPLDGTVAANVLAHGTGAMNIDGCRVGVDPSVDDMLRTVERKPRESQTWEQGSGFKNEKNSRTGVPSLGRWPANLIHDGSDEVVGLFPVNNPHKMVRNRTLGARPFNNDGKATEYETTETIEDSGGSAARFFYCAKANKNDRNEGLEEFEDRKKVFNGKTALPSPSNDVEGSVNEKFSTHPQKNHHPTVKPTALMRYLCKLVTCTDGIVLDPFCGSGSTGKAAILEGFRFIGIEKDPEYYKIADARINFALKSLSESTDTSHNELEVGVNTQSDMFK